MKATVSLWAGPNPDIRFTFEEDDIARAVDYIVRNGIARFEGQTYKYNPSVGEIQAIADQLTDADWKAIHSEYNTQRGDNKSLYMVKRHVTYLLVTEHRAVRSRIRKQAR
jgi:hypothetical protein